MPSLKLADIVQIALPYNQPVYTKVKEDGVLEEQSKQYQGTNRQEEAADDDEDEPVVRITTRARITYELDRFDKNAMLIITNNHNDQLTMFNLKHAFQRYKFEVTIIETDEEGNQYKINKTWEDIDKFFTQDFSNVGAVAVVMSTSTRCLQAASTQSTPNTATAEKRDLLKYFIDSPILMGRPKIFISEARDAAVNDAILFTEGINAGVGSTSSGFTGLPDDVLLLQAKIVYDNKLRRPLDLLSQELNSMDTSRNVQEMLPRLYEKAKKTYWRHRAPIKYRSTLTKDLVLDRLEANNEDPVIQWLERAYNQPCWPLPRSRRWEALRRGFKRRDSIERTE